MILAIIGIYAAVSFLVNVIERDYPARHNLYNFIIAAVSVPLDLISNDDAYAAGSLVFAVIQFIEWWRKHRRGKKRAARSYGYKARAIMAKVRDSMPRPSVPRLLPDPAL
jgi:hypothetical protein